LNATDFGLVEVRDIWNQNENHSAVNQEKRNLPFAATLKATNSLKKKEYIVGFKIRKNGKI
jgi:hypothetical protein